mmetsp:Transcript_22434/g.71147  ORF Transcript_22434/g.71147 Transcript_22434/m.71147 type:complete len:104 (+) Transcript_22434:27-338(+)
MRSAKETALLLGEGIGEGMREDVDMAVSFARSFKSNRKGAASPALDRPQLESAAAAAASAAQAAAALRERGEKLSQLDDKFRSLADGCEDFAATARKLRQQQQ